MSRRGREVSNIREVNAAKWIINAYSKIPKTGIT